MDQRTPRFALVLLAVVFITGFPALAVGDDPSAATGDRSASAPLTTDVSTTTGDGLTSTEATTTVAATTATTTSATTLMDAPITETETVTTGPTVTTTVLDTTATAPGDDAETAASNVADEATNAKGEVTNTTGSPTTSSNVSLASVTDDSTDTLRTLSAAKTSGTASYFSTKLATDADSLDVSDADASNLDSELNLNSDSVDGRPSSDGDRTTDATTTADSESVAADAAGGRANDGSEPSEREGSPTPSRPSELAASVGALTAAALLPQLVDAFALVGNAGAVSASSAALGSTVSVSRRTLRSRLDRLWRLVAPFRYSRYDDSDPLDLDARRALYETVEHSPGTYLSALCDHTDVPLSTARYHLDVLEREGLVTTAKVRGRRRFYPSGSEDVEVELAAALEDEGTAAVLDALARLGASHGGRLADELDLDASTVSHHLSRLEDAELVEREREGRAVVNRLVPEARSVLASEERSDVAESGVAESDVEERRNAESEGRAEAD